ncbi:hypothetical protein LIER_30306 [Lithospermum erythrorhizon]|uniref:SPARK domain-containing protein n=1 Tax=Lithospermum erythrorhizon TaxID=34254 RepID=A0AAV3RM95_LITER
MLHHSFYLLLILTHLPTLPAPPVIPRYDPDSTQTRTENILPTQSPPSTIPAFPEQSNIAFCPLDLPKELFRDIKPACQSKHDQPDPNSHPGQLLKNRCCPVLAAWLYSAYSKTALHGATTNTKTPLQTSPVDMPVLPDDSETCVGNLEKELNNKGIKLFKPNDTCDAIYCYCGIRLHSFSCPHAFFVNQEGTLAGDESVKMLEKDCLSHNPSGYSGLGGCSKCLNSLYLLSENKAVNNSKSEDKRSSKMRSKDCELMGLTWLLNKNRTAYIRTVSAVLRALMMSDNGYSDSASCTINSNDMPLAVDSSEMNDQSSGTIRKMSLFLILFATLMCTSFGVSINQYY